MQKVYTLYYMNAVLLDLIRSGSSASGLLNGAKCGLFQGSPTLGPDTTIADLTASGILPTYTGYASKTVTWDPTAFRGPSGNLTVHGEVAAPFAPTDAVTPNIITGMYVCDSTGAHLFYAEFLDAPLNFVDAYSFLAPDIYMGTPVTGDNDLVGGS